jgi:hypothetical protein
MASDTIYSVSGSSNHHRSLVLRDGARSLALVEASWGTPLSASWAPPEFVAVEKTVSLPEADFSAVYVPGLLLTSPSKASAISFPELECLPAHVGAEGRVLLNPLITLRRFREEGADFLRVPSGAILLLSSADFYADDIPAYPALFWFHDGNAPRFLLCNEAFRSRSAALGASGLSFQRLGYAQ